MSHRTLRIATRKSPLAMWQAEHVAERLKALHPDLDVELVGMSTQGDKILDTPLAKIGGKALFVKELEQGMAEGRADIAVHSMKDVPAQLPEGFDLPVIMEREDPFDAFVSNSAAEFDDLPQGAVLGTASMRRQCQLLARRPDLRVRTLRGNVNTRLAKLDAGEYDAIVLACSGLKRLEFHSRIRQSLPPEISLPAVGQGALGIECRAGDDAVRELIAPLADLDTTHRVLAERAMNARLEGGCQVPIAGYAVLQDGQIYLRGLVGALDGSEVIRGEIRGAPEDGPALGRQLGEDLLARGAGRILKQIYG